ncbi:hypothetical protein CCP3SC1_260034 [Gammaproteobacteria bacterium]
MVMENLHSWVHRVRRHHSAMPLKPPIVDDYLSLRVVIYNPLGRYSDNSNRNNERIDHR